MKQKTELKHNWETTFLPFIKMSEDASHGWSVTERGLSFKERWNLSRVSGQQRKHKGSLIPFFLGNSH